LDSAKNKTDLSALKFNQLSITSALLIGFVFNFQYAPAAVALIMLGGTIVTRLSLFKQIYRYVIVPLKLMKPNIVEESQKPHNFAQGLGGIVLAIASILIFSGLATAGWALVWFVIILALANILFGFCAGCFIYFQLGKFGLPGFNLNNESGVINE
jgi:hypothetical protein